MITRHAHSDKLPPPAPDYEADPIWRLKPLTPAQVLIHDIYQGTSEDEQLEIYEVPSPSQVPDDAKYTTKQDVEDAHRIANNPIDEQRYQRLEQQYGWLKYLRVKHDANEDQPTLRWIHVSSKFTEYLPAFLWALSDKEGDAQGPPMRLLDEVINRYKRHSKYGEYFVPFCEQLVEGEHQPTQAPLFISCPWLDWSVAETPPPLRFQIDRREGFASARTSAHLLRSILQHYYRLEDTKDREKMQVFTKHKPWAVNKALDLRVRQWYGHYPSSLVVDEIWILVVDQRNIVTFSSNVTWKSRWPPLQLSARIAEVAFRDFRNASGHLHPSFGVEDQAVIVSAVP